MRNMEGEPTVSSYRSPVAGSCPTLCKPAEEAANSITHGIGFFLSLIGAPWLIHVAVRNAGPWELAGCCIYGTVLITLYGASTLSHACRAPQRRQFFRRLDQAAIYLLIAGTYTAPALAYLRGGAWWILSALVWLAALVGFASKVIYAHRVECVSVPLYVATGALPLISLQALLATLPLHLLLWMIAGSLVYTAGLFFLCRDSRVPYSHAIWHTMVMAASACQYFAILDYCATYRG